MNSARGARPISTRLPKSRLGKHTFPQAAVGAIHRVRSCRTVRTVGQSAPRVLATVVVTSCLLWSVWIANGSVAAACSCVPGGVQAAAAVEIVAGHSPNAMLFVGEQLAESVRGEYPLVLTFSVEGTYGSQYVGHELSALSGSGGADCGPGSIMNAGRQVFRVHRSETGWRLGGCGNAYEVAEVEAIIRTDPRVAEFAPLAVAESRGMPDSWIRVAALSGLAFLIAGGRRLSTHG